jgi:tRNA G18 (ribose-2'-O)-methylase SpoU
VAYVLGELSEEHRKYFASLKGVSGHIRDGIFIAEGPKIVEHMLRSNADVPLGFMTEDFFSQYETVLSRRTGEGTKVHVAPKSEMEAIVGFSLHQGVMLAVRIPQQPNMIDLTEGSDPKTIVALEGIADAENMGTIIRTCAAFGVDALIVDETCCHPFLRRSVRVSMGTVINLPIVTCQSLAGTLRELKNASFTTIAAALTTNAKSIDKLPSIERVAMIFGAEGVGLSAQIIDQADTVAMIPMSAGIDSLNVGVACGIFLHERMRVAR